MKPKIRFELCDREGNREPLSLYIPPTKAPFEYFLYECKRMIAGSYNTLQSLNKQSREQIEREVANQPEADRIVREAEMLLRKHYIETHHTGFDYD